MKRMGRGLRGLELGWSWGLVAIGVVRVAVRVGICNFAGYNIITLLSYIHPSLHVSCNTSYVASIFTSLHTCLP